MRERVVVFGKGAELVGVVAEASRAHARPDWPAIILVNAGLLHKVGASRLHVRLARTLAPLGFTVLRFDLAGIGDSEPRRQVMSFEDSAVADIVDAMDHLSAGASGRSFVLIGLCSGSDMAFAAARQDPRVIGLVQLDAYAYRNWKWHLHHYGPRLCSPARWWHFVDRHARQVVGLPPRNIVDERDTVISPYARQFPPKAQVHADLAALAARGLRFFNVFSGGQRDHYNYARQHEDTFGDIDFGDRLRVEFLPSADHVFTGLDDQQHITNAVRDWLLGFVPQEKPEDIAPAQAS
jgi:hypothetical protein